MLTLYILITRWTGIVTEVIDYVAVFESMVGGGGGAEPTAREDWLFINWY